MHHFDAFITKNVSVPYSAKFAEKIKSNLFNQHLQKVHNCSLRQAADLVAQYEQAAIGRDGLLRDDTAHRQSSIIKMVYHDRFQCSGDRITFISSRSELNGLSKALNQLRARAIMHLPEVSAARRTAILAEQRDVGQYWQDLIKNNDTQALQQLESILDRQGIKRSEVVLSVIDTVAQVADQALSANDQLAELQGILDHYGLDFVMTKKDLLEHVVDEKIIKEIIQDPMVNAEIKEGLRASASQAVDTTDAVRNMDLIYDAFVERIEQAQRDLERSSASRLEKVVRIGLLQGLKKSVRLDQAVKCHPVDTAYNFVKDVGKLLHNVGYTAFVYTAGSDRQRLDYAHKMIRTGHAFYCMPRVEKFKLAVDVAFDLPIQKKIFDGLKPVAGVLKQVAQDLRVAERVQSIASNPARLKQVQNLAVEAELKATQITKLRDTLVEVAVQKEKELFSAQSSFTSYGGGRNDTV